LSPHAVAKSTYRLILVAGLALTAGASGGEPWDKLPEQWNLAEVNRILQDSPWSPAKSKIDVSWRQYYTDPKTGRAIDSPIEPAPAVSVLWWSNTVRLARQRLRQLRNPAASADPLQSGEWPDIVLAIEGSLTVRFLRDARHDLDEDAYLQHATGTVDLRSVRFIEGGDEDEVRVEFHFPRQFEGGPALDPNADSVVFYCTASAKDPRTGRQNTLSIRAEFDPRTMRVRGQPDL
jgi:hypothetical protein